MGVTPRKPPATMSYPGATTMPSLPLGPRRRAVTTDRRVHLVVTCTSRKRLPPHPDLTIRAATDTPGIEPWKDWHRRLEHVDAPVMEAAELYVGQHWHLAKALVAA